MNCINASTNDVNCESHTLKNWSICSSVWLENQTQQLMHGVHVQLLLIRFVMDLNSRDAFRRYFDWICVKVKHARFYFDWISTGFRLSHRYRYIFRLDFDWISTGFRLSHRYHYIVRVDFD